jgi:hypothetical protein
MWISTSWISHVPGLPVWRGGTVANAGVRIVPNAPIPITTSAIGLICFIILICYVLLHKSIKALQCVTVRAGNADM